MPTDYVKKLAKKKGVSVDEAEKTWKEAKAKAKEEGHGDDYGYITGIFKGMMGVDEATLMSFNDFLTEKRLEEEEGYTDKIAKRIGITRQEAEDMYELAKQQASEMDKGRDYDYIRKRFRELVGVETAEDQENQDDNEPKPGI